MYVLDELWRGEITPSERGYRKDSPYAALVRQANETADIFYKELSPVGKKAYGDLYKAFTKQSASRRFSVSC